MKREYMTGGKKDGKGLAPYDSGSKGTVDVTARGAGYGTGCSVNEDGRHGAGGHGSSGGRSTSKPSKG